MIPNPNFIELLNAHELSAFEMLYQHYYKTLTLFAYDFVGNKSEAEDIVQDVIVAIWLREDHFENIKSFEAYLYNAIKNKAINVLRRKNTSKRYTEQKVNEIECYDAPNFTTEELYLELFKAIDSLPNRCREVLLLGMEGKSNADIAEQLQLSIETIKTHRKRALSMLRQTLKESPAFIILTLLSPLIY